MRTLLYLNQQLSLELKNNASSSSLSFANTVQEGNVTRVTFKELHTRKGYIQSFAPGPCAYSEHTGF